MRIQDFAGLAKVKEGLLRFTEKPYSASFIFKGDSGTGKSTMARIVAEQIDAELVHVPAQECSVDRLRSVVSNCRYAPMSGCRFWLVLVDEADSMSKAARDFLLSPLDKLPPLTVFVFTCNSVESFEGRFMSRSMVLDFSNYGIQKDAAELLAEVWKQEAPGKESPNVARIIKDAQGNVRAALKALEWELKLI
jgi:putative ATPase